MPGLQLLPTSAPAPVINPAFSPTRTTLMGSDNVTMHSSMKMPAMKRPHAETG